MTSIVVDASFAAAWFLPDEDRAAADAVAVRFATDRIFVPDLFRHELRNLLLTALRRGRLSEDECFRQIARAERFPLVDCGAGDALRIAELAVKRGLTAYDPPICRWRSRNAPNWRRSTPPWRPRRGSSRSR